MRFTTLETADYVGVVQKHSGCSMDRFMGGVRRLTEYGGVTQGALLSSS